MGNGFRELRVWQDAKALAVDIYRLVRKSPALDKDWGLKDQIQRSAISVPSNIAEGDARKSDKDSIRFFHIALGSLAELRTQIEISMELKIIPEKDACDLLNRAEGIAKGIGSLARSRRSN